MSTIPYHQAKELIERRVAEYTRQFEGMQLPEIRVERREQRTSIDFELADDTDMY
jgi:hypothetical protein